MRYIYRKKTGLLYVLMASAALTTGMAFATTYEINQGKEHEVCREINRLLRDPGSLRKNVCGWQFAPKAGRVISPEWTAVDGSLYLHYFKQMSTQTRYSNPQRTPEEREAYWQEKYRERDLKDIIEKRYRLYEAMFDLNGDGQNDHLLIKTMVPGKACDQMLTIGDYEPPSPQIFVIKPGSQELDPYYGTLYPPGTYNPMRFDGMTYEVIYFDDTQKSFRQAVKKSGSQAVGTLLVYDTYGPYNEQARSSAFVSGNIVCEIEVKE